METIKDLKVCLENHILANDNIVIVPHNNIDFDAIGSAIGLSLIAKKFKKQSCIVVDDPIYKIDHGIQVIIDDARGQFSIINREKYLQNASPDDFFILTDVNKKNLISLNSEITRPDKVFIIDHHDEGDTTVDSDFKYIDPYVSSASEIVTKLLTLFKVKCSPDIANYLLAGIYLDTDKLHKLNDRTSAETYRACSKLVECGASPEHVLEFFMEDFHSDRRVQELVGKARMITYSIAMIVADEGEEYTREELAKAADYLLKYRVDAAFAIGSVGEDTISISARSKGKIHVGNVMKEFQGGGNMRSGATKLKDTTEEEVGKKLSKFLQPPCYVE